MTTVVVLGLLAGVGLVGIAAGLRSTTPSLEAVAGVMARAPRTVRDEQPSDRGAGRAAHRIAEHPRVRSMLDGDRGGELISALAVTDESLEGLCSRILILGGAALVAPPIAWLALDMAGAVLPLGIAAAAVCLLVPVGVGLPLITLVRRARARRRHVRTMLSSFVDLTVLGLAGGVGVEGALSAASQISHDWSARRIARALGGARDSGMSTWGALGRLGDELGVAELVELAATLQLAGTEGAKVRQTLSARSAALRRHQQADAESEANAVTERLFLPGALLLIGFLLFIGYPAFARILGGF